MKEETITLDRDLRKIPIFAVGPDSNEKLPAIIIIHEIFGVNDYIKDVANRFANVGMRAYAPDLFAPSPLYPKEPAKRDDLDTMRELWMSIPDSQLLSDLQGVFGLIAGRPDVLPHSIGTIGFCMGGAISLMFACSEPRLACVIDYYGRIKYGALTSNKPKHPIDFTANLKCPLLGLFAGKDELIPFAHRDELAAQLTKNKKSFQMKVYDDAQHAFFNDRRQNYDANASADAWRLTLDFLKAHTAVLQAD